MGIGTSAARRMQSLLNPDQYSTRSPMFRNGIGDGVIVDPGSLAPTMMAAPSGLDPAQVKRPGIFDRIGMELDKPGVRAALLRSGAATLTGGLGAGVQAADQFLNQRAQNDLEQQRIGLQGRGVDIQQQTADQTGAYQQGSLENDAARILEEGRSHRANEALTGRGQTLDYTSRQTANQVARQNALTGANASMYGDDRRLQGTMYNTDKDLAGRTYSADKSLEGTKYAADKGYDRSIYGSDVKAAGIAGQPLGRVTQNVGGTRMQMDVFPMPADDSQLVVGRVYQGAAGLGRWTGAGFEKVQQ